ncbi:baseplate J/gp47 family protein [Paenibacillus sp. GbtcB18]|uniref:baseplate J/gp47 family protein n=1 Tax=Paenibacillus sp. GbtcB18 TaxID=2824763 RepID=UPI002815BCB7|nr:baseplate J/gp47 family protein [Paenibacillus sp. GbtcB18]
MALAPAAVELAQAYAALDQERSLGYADTSSGEYLERRTAEYGITRERMTKARKKGAFYANGDVPLDIPIGSRYTAQTTNFVAIERLQAGQFVLEAETPGSAANGVYGALIPIDYIPDLARAELVGEIVPGEDDETDDALRNRYLEAINEQPFGGNVADYRVKLGRLPGVGGVKVFPAWRGGGTVRCVLITSDYGKPSGDLVNEVQTAADPLPNSGEGLGFAPIGHRVTVAGANDVKLDVETTITLANNTTISQVKPEIEEVIETYLLLLRQTWKDEDYLIVRVSQVEARILNVPGVTDIANTKLNGVAGNVELQAEEIPFKGAVTLRV